MAVSLRRTLLDLVLAAAPAAALTGCFFSTTRRDEPDPPAPDAPLDCTDYFEYKQRIPEPPPSTLETMVRACEADATMCRDLCVAVLAEANIMRTVETCTVAHDATGHDVTIGYTTYNGSPGCPVDGRRPAGLAHGRGRACSGAARHLARAAWFEAASVHAFVQVARELARHGAPIALQRAAQAAAVDEVLHARLICELAHARGALPPAAEVAPPKQFSLEAFALDNASEGLVGETWSALIATWQAAHAPDQAMRAIYARIAADETRHAELSRDIHAWAISQLPPAACRRVARARDRAVARLARSVRTAPPPALVRELGLPEASAAVRLFAGARDALWS